MKKIISMGMAMMLLLAGCGGSADKAAVSEEKMYRGADVMDVAGDMEGAYEATEAAAAEEDYAKYDLADEAVEEESGAGGSSSSISDNNTNTTINTEKLIYNCTLRFDTLDYKKSITSLKTLIADNGGFIENETESSNSRSYDYDYIYNDNTKSAELFTYTATIRVPSANYEKFVNGTGDLGDMRNKNASVTNVSTEYYDLQAELKVYETKYQRYLDMLSKAEDVEEILQIENNIMPIETRINQIKTRMNSINNDVAYSFVNIVINEVKEYEVREEKNETFFQRLSREFSEATKDFGYRVQDFIIYIATHIFDIIVFIVVVIIGIKVFNSIRRKRRIKKGLEVDDKERKLFGKKKDEEALVTEEPKEENSEE